jgi:hypothetical protein
MCQVRPAFRSADGFDDIVLSDINLTFCWRAWNRTAYS